MPIAFNVTGLPTGLGVSGSEIFGVPTQNGTFNVTINASNGTPPADAKTLVLTISSFGIVTTVAGNGVSAFSGDGGLATEEALSAPDDVSLDANGDMVIADHNNNRIRRVDAVTGVITTIAGGGQPSINDGEPATEGVLAVNGDTAHIVWTARAICIHRRPRQQPHSPRRCRQRDHHDGGRFGHRGIFRRRRACHQGRVARTDGPHRRCQRQCFHRRYGQQLYPQSRRGIRRDDHVCGHRRSRQYRRQRPGRQRHAEQPARVGHRHVYEPALFADSGNERTSARCRAGGGNIVPVAGSTAGTVGNTGDNAAAASCTLSNPRGIGIFRHGGEQQGAYVARHGQSTHPPDYFFHWEHHQFRGSRRRHVRRGR